MPSSGKCLAQSVLLVHARVGSHCQTAMRLMYRKIVNLTAMQSLRPSKPLCRLDMVHCNFSCTACHVDRMKSNWIRLCSMLTASASQTALLSVQHMRLTEWHVPPQDCHHNNNARVIYATQVHRMEQFQDAIAHLCRSRPSDIRLLACIASTMQVGPTTFSSVFVLLTSTLHSLHSLTR